MNQIVDFALYAWRTAGPSLLIMLAVVIAYTAGKERYPWWMLISAVMIGISCGWISYSAEVRGKEKLMTALVDAGRAQAPGGGE